MGSIKAAVVSKRGQEANQAKMSETQAALLRLSATPMPHPLASFCNVLSMLPSWIWAHVILCLKCCDYGVQHPVLLFL